MKYERGGDMRGRVGWGGFKMISIKINEISRVIRKWGLR
jgi:hypothetical protein